jgi:CheY-like chemotaxis protein
VRSVGYEAVETGDGEVALRMLRQITPDVILLDLRLPHRSGADILSYIQNEPRLRHSRVVIVTAHSVVIEDDAPAAGRCVPAQAGAHQRAARDGSAGAPACK